MSSIPLPALTPYNPPRFDIAEEMGKVLTLRQLMGASQLQQQQVAGAQLENQQRQFALQQQQAGINAMRQWDGENYDELPDLMAKNGASLQTVMQAKAGIADYKQKLATLSKDQQQILKDNNDWAAGQIEALKSLPPEQQPQAFERLKAGYLSRPGVDQQSAQQISSMQYQGPQQLDILEKSLMGHAALIDQSLKASEQQKNVAQAGAAEQSGRKAKIEADALEQLGGFSPELLRSKYIALTTKQQQGIPISPADKAFLASYQKEKLLVPQFNINVANATGGGPNGQSPAQRFGVSPEAFDQAAEKYYQTGQLPPIGRGNPNAMAMNRALMNRAAELHPGGNLAGNQAAFSANKKSLEQLQSTTDQMEAFEKTAGKNLDQFLNTAGKVIDAGSPWVNRPLRTVSTGGLGSGDLAAYNAARQTAVNEISRVLNSTKGTGVVSDSARQEVEGLMSPNASLTQVYKAAQVLRQDMKNRRDSYQEQIQDIKGRMGSQGGMRNTPQAGGSHPFFSQLGGTVVNQ